MNIFAVSPDPAVCAAALDDRRLNKMIVETAQIICNAYLLNYARRGFSTHRMPYRPFNPGHPVVKWAASDEANLLWTRRLFSALAYERSLRMPEKPVHASVTKMGRALQLVDSVTANAGNPTSFCNCAANDSLGISFRHLSDTHAAYRAYLRARWRTAKRPVRFTRRPPPTFFPEEVPVRAGGDAQDAGAGLLST